MTAFLLSIGLPLLWACNPRGSASGEHAGEDRVLVDQHFTGLFSGNVDGFTGGDGTYSVALPDGRTAWIFGDTFIEGLGAGNTRIHQVPRFIRNSVIIQDGDSLHTLYQQFEGTRASFAIPPGNRDGDTVISEDSVWFWPGDGFIEGGQLKIFLSEFVQKDTGMWDFEWRGTWIASYDLPEVKEVEITEIPVRVDMGIHFGHAVHVDEAYTYIYGLGSGHPHVARVPIGDVLQPWEYWNGSGWTLDPGMAGPMAQILGSEQFSVFKQENGYVLLTQMRGFSDEICTFTSATPFGPWENRQMIYKTPLPDSTRNLFTYNALAHPQFTENGMLLVSYNMNSMVLEDHFRNAGIYRPRFVRVPLGMILEGAGS